MNKWLQTALFIHHNVTWQGGFDESVTANFSFIHHLSITGKLFDEWPIDIHFSGSIRLF